MICPRTLSTALLLLSALLPVTTLQTPKARAAPPTIVPPAADSPTLYVGGYTPRAGDGLGALRFDTATGTLSDMRVVAPLRNPDWLTLNAAKNVLYASGTPAIVTATTDVATATTDKTGGLTAYAIGNDGGLREISRTFQPENPVSMVIDASGRWLVGAFYGSGNWGVWPLQKDGAVGECTVSVSHQGRGPDAARQSSPHPHQAMVAPDNRRIWICDLGTDRAMIYDFDAQTGAVEPSVPAFITLPAGSGPRHLTFAQSGQIVYILSELSNTISVVQGGRGRPGTIQTLSTLPANFAGASHAAEILVSPDGRFLYASNRGYNSIAQFAIGRDGTLKLVGFTPVGSEPRHFTFDPSGHWLLVGNQRERSIAVFTVNQHSGLLELNSRWEGVPNEPTCLIFGK